MVIFIVVSPELAGCSHLVMSLLSKIRLQRHTHVFAKLDNTVKLNDAKDSSLLSHELRLVIYWIRRLVPDVCFYLQAIAAVEVKRHEDFRFDIITGQGKK